MQDEQNLERVRLTFDKFNVPMADKQCSDGYLKVCFNNARNTWAGFYKQIYALQKQGAPYFST